MMTVEVISERNTSNSVSLHITLHTLFLGGWEVKEVLPRDDMEQNDKMSFYFSINFIAG